MASDLQRYYGLDLRDAFRPGSTLTARYVLLLVEHLPEDSATHAAMRGGPQFRPWTASLHLQAATVNLLNAANHQRARKRAKALVKPPQRKVTRKRTVKVGQVGSRAVEALRRLASS